MKRTVTINSVGVNGVGLIVKFSGHPPVDRLDLNAEFSSFSHGYAENDDGLFCTVWSRPFKNTEKAELWLSELTEEVKELAGVTEATIASFKSLESTIDV